MKQQFGGGFTEDELKEISYILKEYTRLNGIRRPEVMTAKVYHPVHYGETKKIRARAKALTETATKLYSVCKKEYKAAFCELVYYPAAASANLILMQTASSLNQFYAWHGMTVANRYAKEIETAIARDGALTAEYHKVADGKWNHMMSSAHIGFRAWNDEGWQYPVAQTVYGVKGARPALRLSGESRVYLGGNLAVEAPRAGGTVLVELLNGGTEPVEFTVTAKGECSTDIVQGSYTESGLLTVNVTGGEAGAAGTVTISANGRRFELKVERVAPALVKLCKGSFTKAYTKQVQGIGDYAMFEAGDFVESRKEGTAEYVLLTNYGRTKDSVKVYPTTEGFSAEQALKHETAELTYLLEVAEDGEYGVVVYVAPTNPLYPGDEQRLALTANEDATQVFTTLPENFQAGNCHNNEWNINVLDNIRQCKLTVTLKKGENRLRIGAVDAGVVVQKLVVYPLAKPLKESYLGPCGE